MVLLVKTHWPGIDAMRAVVRTREEFERLWQKSHERTISPPPPPSVDFSRDMVIVAALGRQAIAGSKIAVAKVTEHGHRLEIRIEAHLVPTACDGFAGVTYPTVFVRVPASQATVIFRDRVIQDRC